MEPRDVSLAAEQELNGNALTEEAAANAEAPQNVEKESVEQQVEATAAETGESEAEVSAEETRLDEAAAQGAEEPTLESTAAEEVAAETVVPATKADVIAAAEALAAGDPGSISAEAVSRIKQQFYSLHNEELRRQRDEFVAAGNDEAAFSPLADADEERLKAIFAEIKEKKAAHRAAVEAEQQANLAAKRDIIAAINSMSEDTDNVHRHFQEVKDLQARFKEIGEVSQDESTKVWKDFQDAVEHYYDQHKVNKELRDYDFKKNLGEKQLLIDEAVGLEGEADVITAFKRLQELHVKWREIGPVAKDLREEVWQRFKDASAVVNKRYQAHFEELKARERANEDAKTAICERVEALDFGSLKSYTAWDAMTREIIQAQEDWKKIGFASRKMNNALFARFRAVCDAFFAAKAAFFKEMKETLAANLEKKTALCEKAEALKESTEWRKTSDELVALQKEWKTIGPVAKKHSDAVWRRFLAACDYFFDAKKKATSGTRKAEQANLKAKREIIAKLREIAPETPRDEAAATIRELQGQWQSTGHVPFGEKDKLYEEYRGVLDELTERFDLRRQRARMENFKENVSRMEGDDNKLYRERERLTRAYEQRRQELNTYENNMGFFNSKSKTGEKMLQDMQRRVESLKGELEELRKKIELVDSKL